MILRRKYVGKNHSLGYRTGKKYWLITKDFRDERGKFYPITVCRIGGGGLCPYSSVDAFNQYWV